jgi:predicted RNA binding protein YcfA (HicA-like mRNA interferase family)
VSQLEKALKRLQRRPTNFTWDEAVHVMKAVGFRLLPGSGSGRRFFHPEKDILVTMHEPHPRKVLKRYQVDALLKALRDAAYMP